jgi:hypothetical protein
MLSVFERPRRYKLNAKRAYTPVLLVVLIMSLGPASAEVVRSNEPNWIQIQDSQYGYAIQCPPDALASRYDPEGILHIVLPEVDRVMTIHARPNPGDLTATAWTDLWLSDRLPSRPDIFGPPPNPVRRNTVRVGDKLGEEVVWQGWEELHRRVIVSGSGRIYLIDHPLIASDSSSLFDRSIATFLVGDFPHDAGFRVSVSETTEGIEALTVPYYSQRALPWKCDQYGTCLFVPSWHTCTQAYTTIEDAGCHISSQAMIFDYYTGHWMDPGELDYCLTVNNQYFWQSYFQGYCAAPSYTSVCMPTSVSYLGWLYMSTGQAVLDADLVAGRPAIGRRLDDGHSVTIIGKSGDSYIIHDPWDGPNITVGAGWFLYFWRYSGSPPTCCGCLPAECCAAALGDSSQLPTKIEWADPAGFNVNGAKRAPSATCERKAVELPARLAEGEVDLSLPDATILPEPERSVLTDALMPAPFAPPPAEAQPREWAAIEAQRTPPASAHYLIPKSVFGSGGGKKISTHYVLNGTQGQTTDLSRRVSASYVLVPGYWAASSPRVFDNKVYLPVILRNR